MAQRSSLSIAAAATLAIGGLVVGLIATRADSSRDDSSPQQASPSGAVAQHNKPRTSFRGLGSEAGRMPSGARGSERSASGSRRHDTAVGRGGGEAATKSGQAKGSGGLAPASPGEVAEAAGRAKGSDVVEPEGDRRPVGALTREAIKDGVQALAPALKTCYEDLLKDFPEASGTVKVGFELEVVDGVGTVDISKVQDGSTLYDKTMEGCLDSSIKDLELDIDEPDGVVQVTYPFQFSQDANAGGERK